ncbi:MAG: (Fe-S)-binding protein [Candidatus Thorarchaeota archaeon]|nr:(Fe-S)-binding protein [Candidatus Thorarchaeota archaeon]
MGEEEAYKYVLGTLSRERIIPYSLHESEVVRSVEACMNCGICLGHCPVVAAVGVDRFSGPRSIAVELSRSPPEFWSTGDKVYLCTGCGTCREVCPKKVDIPEVVNIVRARLFATRPDLVPRALHGLRETIEQHALAFTPWDDPEEKAESRDMHLEHHSLPYIPDRTSSGAKVLYYPGCQAEERSQEVREAAKLILHHFGVDYSVMDEMSCCGLPSRLMGDRMNAERLAETVRQKALAVKAEMIVTTCAGCTSNLTDMSTQRHWGLPVYHIIEFLVEQIGLGRVISELSRRAAGSDTLRLAVHDPCHLIRHVSRRVSEYALDILDGIPGVEVVRTGVSDSCCGGGGLVAHHSRDVADAVTVENAVGIMKCGADRVVAPCPLCTSQIEDSLFKAGSSVQVDDLTVFIATRLPLRR